MLEIIHISRSSNADHADATIVKSATPWMCLDVIGRAGVPRFSERTKKRNAPRAQGARHTRLTNGLIVCSLPAPG
jgi:hypothetical protein